MSLLLLIGWLGSSLGLAQQSNPPDDENRMSETLRSDFKEGMFERVQGRIKEFLHRFPASSHRFEFQLIQAKSLYYLGQYEQSLAALVAPSSQVPASLRASYIFWQGEDLSQLDKWAEAEKKYRELLVLQPEKELQLTAQLSLAWSLFKQDKEAEAHQVLDPLVANQGKDSGLVGYKASIYLARILISKSQGKEAASLLGTLLANKPPPGIALEANYWLGEIAQADNRAAAALVNYGEVTSDPKAFPRSLVAQSWFGSGVCQQKLSQHDKAMQSFEQAYTIGDDEQLKLASFKLYLQSAQILQRLPEAEAALRAFAKGNLPITASGALFAIGSSQAEQKQTDQAIDTLEDLLTAYPESVWRSAANYQLGNLYRDNNQPDLALKAYQACLDDAAAEKTPAQQEMQQEVIFKMGEIYFSQNDLTKAAANFQKAAEAGGGSAEKALFNLILVQAQRDDLDGFSAAETKFEQQFPKSLLLARLTLEKARLLERKGQLDKARQTYQDALAKNLDPAQRPFFLLRLADLYYLSGQYEEALKACEDLVTNYPKDDGVPKATYKAIWCNYLLKRLSPDQTRAGLLELYKKYPQDSHSAAALFNAAEFSFNAQDYAEAQIRFEELVKVFPQSDLVDQALYFAGDSAANLKDYTRALEILEKVKEGSGSKIDAQMLEGDIYRKELKFGQAFDIFDNILITEKSGSPHFVEATLAKGDCLFALGSDDNSKYELAAAAFRTILEDRSSTNQGNLAQRNEAAFTRARCFEMLNRPADALALYLDVLNGQPGQSENPTDPSAEVLPPEIYWRVKAGDNAAELRKKDQDWQGALAIYRKLEQIGGPLQKQFSKDIDALRREHFLYDEGT